MPNRRYQRTATTITSGGNRNPANADRDDGGMRRHAVSLTGTACPTTPSTNATPP
jgi:hypothetical protein